MAVVEKKNDESPGRWRIRSPTRWTRRIRGDGRRTLIGRRAPLDVEPGDGARLALVVHLEVFLREVADRVALCIANDYRHQHRSHFYLENHACVGRRGRLGLLRRRRRCLRISADCRREENHCCQVLQETAHNAPEIAALIWRTARINL